VATSRSFSEAADVYSLGLLLWELATEIRPQRTLEEISSGAVPAIPSEAEAHLKEEGGNIAEDFLNLIRSCLAVDAKDRINSRKLVREMVKLHDAAVLKPGEKPAAVKRRRTKERGLGGRAIQSSDTGEESTHVVPSPKPRHSPKKGSHSLKASVEEGPFSPRKRKDRPTSPSAIHFETTDSSAIAPPSKSDTFSEESAPNRVSIGEVVELSPRERKPSKKSKQKA
jgi:serine/threonine protein kinase